MSEQKTKKQPELNIRNKKAGFEYEFLDHYTAGIVLKGTEIKSIRLGKASINEAYCYVEKGEVFIKNMHISPYENASFYKHDPKSVRKLLLNKHEIYKIISTEQFFPDDISKHLDIPISVVLVVLSEMEVLGIIEKTFEGGFVKTIN